MKVRFIGFSFEPKSIISLDDLISNLVLMKDEQYQFGEQSRMVFVNRNHNKDYYLGVLITIKDQKRFCELASEMGELKIKVNDLEKGHNIMDFNFFVINKISGFGLYQHYHQSCSVNQFGYLMSHRYSLLRDSKVKSEIELEQNKSQKKLNEKSIKKKYAGQLAWHILVRKEKLKEILGEFEKIKSFEFDFLHLEAKEKEYEPLSPYVKKERRQFGFIQNSPVHVLSQEIGKIVNSIGITKGRVVGEDKNGIERAIRIMDNPDNYGEYEYDDITKKLNLLTLDKFESSWVVEELLKKCQNFKYIFEAKAR